MPDAVSIQRAYYSNTASQYDAKHLHNSEHELALTFMLAAIRYLDIQSVLDVGSGTGRALSTLKSACPRLRIVGIEPSAALREQGYAKGLERHELIDGDGHAIQFADGAFDLVCAYGVLHHVPKPRVAVREMLRVSKRVIFISDANNFGQGSPLSRIVKQAFHAAGLWPAVNFVKTKGKGYSISDGDGLFYSYSLFDDYPQIKDQCKSVHLFNTLDGGHNLYRSAPHLALLGIK